MTENIEDSSGNIIGTRTYLKALRFRKGLFVKAAWDGKMRWQAMLTSVNGSWSFPIRPSRSEIGELISEENTSCFRTELEDKNRLLSCKSAEEIERCMEVYYGK